MRVVATAAQGPKSPAFRIRIGMLAPALREQQVDVELQPLFDERQARAFATASARRRAGVLLRARGSLRRRLAATGAGAAFVQRHVDMLPSMRLERMAVSGRRLVLDIDDAVWLDGPVAGGHPLARLKRGEPKTRWLAERADAVLAGNEILAGYLGEWSDRVQVVPSLVDVEATPLRRHADAEAVTLGWIGSPTTSRYLAEAAGPLERFAAAVAPRPVRLLVVGGAAPAVRGVRIEEREWSEAAERAALEEIDIGLMPLPDTSWTRGKCAYKAIQYMAAGIPVVADDVGVTGDVVARAGFALSDRGDWVEALEKLAASASLRGELGARGRERVTADFSVDRWLPVIAGALKGA